MCLAQGPQCSVAGEARTRGPSVSSQALYFWATALPSDEENRNNQIDIWRQHPFFKNNGLQQFKNDHFAIFYNAYR